MRESSKMLTENRTPLLDLEGVEREYTEGKCRIRALRGIDLKIYPGEFVAIWGPSGSGKSTLLSLLSLIDLPDRGVLKFSGRDAAKLSDNVLSDYRNRSVGLVFQSFNLIPVLTALNNVALPLQIQGVSSSEVERRSLQSLSQVGLAAFRDFRPDRLSGGQRQRVAIARALVCSPSLLIADEPTANLDSQNSLEVIALIESLNRETGVTCIFTTHDARLLSRVPRRLKLDDGRVLEDSGLS